MPLYKIIPVDDACDLGSVTVADAASVLHAFQRLGCEEAEVLQDDDYRYSVRLREDGLWHIFQRDGHSLTELVTEWG